MTETKKETIEKLTEAHKNICEAYQWGNVRGELRSILDLADWNIQKALDIIGPKDDPKGTDH